MKQFERSLTKDQNDLNLLALYEMASGMKVRIRIRRNSYDFQSFAIVEAFSKALTKWEEVASIPWSEMASLNASVYDRVTNDAAFANDEARLLNLAYKILGEV